MVQLAVNSILRIPPLLGDADDDVFRPVIWSVVLIACLIALFLAVNTIRRWLRRGDEEAKVGFTLGDLRSLHREGKMTDEEFERAKSLLIGQTQAEVDRMMSRKTSVAKAPVKRGGKAELEAYAASLLEQAAERAAQKKREPDHGSATETDLL